jgi:predicted MPP superfamily phosphohydrolase
MPDQPKQHFLRRCFTRRRFLQATAAATLTGLYTWQVEPHWLEIVYRDLPIAGLPPALAGKRLVQLSDIHIGPQVDDVYIAATFQRVAALQPDIVVHTGDLITYWKDDRPIMQAARLLAHFPHGRLGTVAILGNHDYGLTFTDAKIALRVEAVLREAGINVLRNATTDIAGLQIIGLDDLWAGRFEPEVAFRSADLARSALVLSHNPDTCDLPGWSGYRGWILSGHTHGGQCKPPFLPPPLLPVKNRRYTASEFQLNNDRRLYISRGVGHLLSVRFNCRPEVTAFRLIPA